MDIMSYIIIIKKERNIGYKWQVSILVEIMDTMERMVIVDTDMEKMEETLELQQMEDMEVKLTSE